MPLHSLLVNGSRRLTVNQSRSNNNKMQQPAAGELVVIKARKSYSFQSTVHPIKPSFFSSCPKTSPQGSQPDDMGADLDSIVSSSTATTSSTSTTSALVVSRTTSLVSTLCSGTSSCTCYQCTRRYYHHHKPTLIDSSSKDYSSWHSEKSNIDAGLKQYNKDNINTQQQQQYKRSMLQRKRPTIHSYNKHLPRPPYAPNDSIYRAHMKPATEATQRQPTTYTEHCSGKNSPSNDTRWFDDSSNVDLVLSFMVFDTIVADQPDDSIFGLTDLIEERTKQLHDSLLDTAEDKGEEENRHDDNGGTQGLATATAASSSASQSSPPPTTTTTTIICKKQQHQCHTLSSRQGPTHHPLTLFHTMKLVNSKERLETFAIAYDHCVRANSGLTDWIKKRSGPPEILCSYTPRHVAWRRPHHKRFGFLPSKLSTRDDGTEEMMAKISSYMPTMHNPYNRHLHDTAITATDRSAPTDLLSAAYALLPNTSSDIRHTSMNRIQHGMSKRSYDHIDTPGRPLSRKDHSRSATIDSSHSISADSSDKDKITENCIHRSSSKRTLNSFGKSTLWKYTRTDTCSIQQQD
ncbi:hypothetical protein K492DRAFT_203872 [Lichtheimia hyalospora FSU 10163]|nr:hypothetical protein K492DRAFT_203872 [Lichtheimia hyalospora FSU 10163]